jgi:DNA-directed RNA polymerase subunit beta
LNRVIAREEGDFPVVNPDEINYMDIAPKSLRQFLLL